MTRQGPTFTDEQLMAYADGASDVMLTSQIEAAMKKNKSVADRIELFRSSSSILKSAFQPLNNPSADSKLIGMIKRSEEDYTADNLATSTIVQFPKQRNHKSQFWQQSIAASVMLAIGLGGGYTLGGARFDQSDSFVAGTVSESLDLALTTLASGESESFGETGVVMIASFRNANGMLCREFEVSTSTVNKSVVIACNSGKQWQTVLQVALPYDNNSFMPAGGHKSVEAYLQAAGMTEPLSIEEEKLTLSK
jgi:hypothetical protein